MFALELECAVPREFVRAYAVRAGVVWTFLRVLVAAVGPSPWSVQGLALAAVATLFIVLLDAEVRYERRFLANLGLGRRWISSVALTTIVAFEGAVTLAAALARLV